MQALRAACSAGSVSSVQLLLTRLRTLSLDISMDIQELLLLSCWCCNFAIINLLFDQGAILEAGLPVQAIDGRFTGTSDEIIALYQFFLNSGWDLNTKSPKAAILKHNLPLLKFLLKNGAEVNEEVSINRVWEIRHPFGTAQGMRPLDTAADCCCIPFLKLLISYGARLEDSNAFHMAASGCELPADRIPTLEFLLDNGMDINGIERIGVNQRLRVFGTALIYAAACGEAIIVKFLLDRQADFTVVDTAGTGRTALHWARNPPGGKQVGYNADTLALLMEAEGKVS